MMADRFIGPEIGNKKYQRQLADTLVAAHGYKEALEICQENAWEGVLHVLYSVRRPASGAT